MVQKTPELISDAKSISAVHILQTIFAIGFGFILFIVIFRGMFPVHIEEPTTSLWDYHDAFCSGVFVSAALSIVAIAGGTFVGLLLALIARMRGSTLIRIVVKLCGVIYVYAFLAIPVYTMILFGYYWGALSNWSAFWIASLALGINLSPFAAQILTTGLANISAAEIESARAFGYEGFQLYWKFHIPALLRSVGRPLLVQYYTTMKLSSLAAVIGVGELMHTGGTVIRATYETIGVYAIVALGYVLMVTPVALLADIVENRNAKQ